MAFLRPEVGQMALRWRETLASAVLLLLGLWLLWTGYSAYNLMGEIIGGVLSLIGGLLLFTSVQRAQFFAKGDAPGMIEVTERQITYFASEDGASVDIAAMTRLELRISLNDGQQWVLKQSEGPTLYIPTAAAGSERLFDAFAALPGMDMARLVLALKDKESQRQIVWRGKAGFRPLT